MIRKKFGVAKQVPEVERENKLIHTGCLSCGEIISHPICSGCVFKQFSKWINKYSEIKDDLMNCIKDYLKKSKSFNENSGMCILCKKERMHICPYCFTECLHDLMKSKKINDRILSEFLFLFNYDFEHKSYARDGLDMPEWMGV